MYKTRFTFHRKCNSSNNIQLLFSRNWEELPFLACSHFLKVNTDQVNEQVISRKFLYFVIFTEIFILYYEILYSQFLYYIVITCIKCELFSRNRFQNSDDRKSQNRVTLNFPKAMISSNVGQGGWCKTGNEKGLRRSGTWLKDDRFFKENECRDSLHRSACAAS